MKQLTKNVFVETGQRGSNHGLVATSDGLVSHPVPSIRATRRASEYSTSSR